MSINNYGELKVAVANWLARDSLTERVPEFIQLAEQRIYLTLRVRELETNADLTTVASQRTNTLPSGYLQFRALYVSGSPNRRLEYRTPINYWSIWASSTAAKPKIFTIEGENVLYGPVPDGVYTVTTLYYQKLSAFSSDSDSNSLFTKAAGLWLYGALLEAAPMLGDDPRILLWAQMWDDILDRVQEADKRDRHSGDALVQSSDVHVE